MNKKIYLDINVLEAAKQRINYILDHFEKVFLSYSGGKDSSALFHMLIPEFRKRNKKLIVITYVWECFFKSTLQHMDKMFEMYKDDIELYYVELPLSTVNGCSALEPEYISFDPKKKDLWVREHDPKAIIDPKFFPFYYGENMKFEEFMPLFGEWLSEGKLTCNLLGIRAQESLKRLMAVSYGSHKKIFFEDQPYISKVTKNVWSAYPIFDFAVEDIWRYYGKENKIYPTIYDQMYKAGLKLTQMRIDEPFSDTARHALWLYHIIEPETWSKMCMRISGANYGAIYSKEKKSGMMGTGDLNLPKGYTWEKFTNFLLDTIPKPVSEHYKNKIAVYIKWFQDKKGIYKVEDFAPKKDENMGTVPSWRQICKCILKNDYYCTSIGFSPTKSSAYQKYTKRMKKNRNEWGIYKEGVSKD
jgi:predicted phosphoadenosine phosphosulfate sulfurtransferase